MEKTCEVDRKEKEIESISLIKVTVVGMWALVELGLCLFVCYDTIAIIHTGGS